MISPQGRDLLIWMVVFTVVNLVVLGLRFYTLAYVKKRSLRVDDFLIVLSVASMLAMEGTTFWAIHHGLGARTSTLPWSDVVVNIKLLVSAFWSWTIATATCKLAILFLYLEIFAIDEMFRKAVLVMMVLCVAYVPTFITVFMTQCSPVSAAWDPVLSLTNCRPRETHELVSVAINVVLDIFVVILPLPVVWKLKMPARKKAAVTGMFSIGLLVIAIMIWRLVSTATAKKPKDLVYDTYLLALQSHLELWLGILAANLPTIVPLGQHWKIVTWDTYFSKNRSGDGSSRGTPKNFSFRTIGGSGGSRRRNSLEFSRLDDEGIEARALVGGIQKTQGFQVSIERDEPGNKPDSF